MKIGPKELAQLSKWCLKYKALRRNIRADNLAKQKGNVEIVARRDITRRTVGKRVVAKKARHWLGSR